MLGIFASQVAHMHSLFEPSDTRSSFRSATRFNRWRCQFCGSMQNLQVHHLKFRSQSGDDVEQNLITLCA